MADKKIVFLAFATKDKSIRNVLKEHSLHTVSPYEFIDMPEMDPGDSNWKDEARNRIRRSHGVLAVVSKNSLTSSGQMWEIECAKQENKKLRGVWAYRSDLTDLAGVNTMVWSWENIAAFIDGL